MDCLRGNPMGPSALSGLRPGPHGGCAPATPSERLKNLPLKAITKEAGGELRSRLQAHSSIRKCLRRTAQMTQTI